MGAKKDKKYVKLNPLNMGFQFWGVVPAKQQAMLLKAFETLKRDMGVRWDSQLSEKEIFWLNVWQDEDDTEDDSDIIKIAEPKIAKALDKWCRKAVREYCEPHAILDGYGFVVNPVGSQQQVWHIDYTTDAAVVWIALTPFTDKNAVQFITLPSNTPRAVLEQLAVDVDEVEIETLARSVDYLTVQQIVAKPMSVFYMGRGTIHRGIANTGEDPRIAFYLSVHFIKDYEKNYPYNSESLQGSEAGVATFWK
ncbi:MAG: hypothetical protein HY231_21665 [Acidobacteria bacterium]|nr:hypothetical protein [Acidobacteriota bacterium]